MKSGTVPLVPRPVRLVLGGGVAFLVWMLLVMRLDHRCALGYKWFEQYSPVLVGIVSAASIVYVCRLWLGSVIAVLIAAAFFQGVIPPYLAWIHGPNAPRFPAVEAQTARVLNDLQPIDSTHQPAPADKP